MRAHIRALEDGELALDAFELVGGIEGGFVLPWRGESKALDLRAGRLRVELCAETTAWTITGHGRRSATLRSRDGQIDLATRSARVEVRPEELRFYGELSGEARLSAAGPLDASARMNLRLTRAQGFCLTARPDLPIWWGGGCAPSELTLDAPECGARRLGDTLVLEDPGYGT